MSVAVKALPLNFSTPQVMGVVNVTPDSFSDGGLYQQTHAAIAHALALHADGAAIVDIGGESTRPGAGAVSIDEECARVLPVIRGIRQRLADVFISIDTSTPEVMTQAAAAGANMINDVRALTRPGALQAAQKTELPVCLMHMQGQPQTMQDSPHYEDVVAQVVQFLQTRIDACIQAGIAQQRICVDPGFGFGKQAVHNATLLAQLSALKNLDCPIVVGLSRKTMIGDLLGLPVNERLYASLALAVMAAERGAQFIRVHDVKSTVQALAMVSAIKHKTIEVNRYECK